MSSCLFTPASCLHTPFPLLSASVNFRPRRDTTGTHFEPVEEPPISAPQPITTACRSVCWVRGGPAKFATEVGKADLQPERVAGFGVGELGCGRPSALLLDATEPSLAMLCAVGGSAWENEILFRRSNKCAGGTETGPNQRSLKPNPAVFSAARSCHKRARAPRLQSESRRAITAQARREPIIRDDLNPQKHRHINSGIKSRLAAPPSSQDDMRAPQRMHANRSVLFPLSESDRRMRGGHVCWTSALHAMGRGMSGSAAGPGSGGSLFTTSAIRPEWPTTQTPSSVAEAGGCLPWGAALYEVFAGLDVPPRRRGRVPQQLIFEGPPHLVGLGNADPPWRRLCEKPHMHTNVTISAGVSCVLARGLSSTKPEYPHAQAQTGSPSIRGAKTSEGVTTHSTTTRPTGACPHHIDLSATSPAPVDKKQVAAWEVVGKAEVHCGGRDGGCRVDAETRSHFDAEPSQTAIFQALMLFGQEAHSSGVPVADLHGASAPNNSVADYEHGRSSSVRCASPRAGNGALQPSSAPPSRPMFRKYLFDRPQRSPRS